MRLFMDLDDTLVYSFPSTAPEDHRPVNVQPTAKAVFPNEFFDVYFRPDLDLLRDVPFSILSHGTQDYVEAVAAILKDEGFPILDVFGREYLDRGDVITAEPSVLIDNLPERHRISVNKMSLLPAGRYLQVDAWEPIAPSASKEWAHSGWERYIPLFPATRINLERIRSEGSRSLEKRLADAGV